MTSITDYAQTILVMLGAATAITVAFGTVYRKMLRPVHQKVARILELTEVELTPNGGGSIKDQIGHIAPNHAAAERHWQELERAQQEIKANLDVNTRESQVHWQQWEVGYEGLANSLAEAKEAMTRAGKTLAAREAAILKRLDKVEVLRAQVDTLHEHALAKAEAREMPPEPTEAPAGSAILPRQVVSLETDEKAP